MSEILALAVPSDLFPARMQMALSLGWHIVVACFGVGFPAMVVFAEWRSHPRGGKDSDKDMDALAHTWAKAMGVLFAVGAVSGTILSFEMGMLWPGLMARFGQIYGFPFTLEGFAFFIESIFVGVYLYGWNRLPPRIHLLSGLPMIAAGVAGAFFVVAANGWMNTPTGFEIRNGQVVNTDPWAAMFNPSTASQSVHMILAAVMVTGFGVASVYAVGMLRGRSDRYHRIGLLVPLTVAAVAAPIQIGVGDWIANVVAKYQPGKLAAMEGLYQSGTGVPLSMGGIYVDDRLVGAIEIPYGLSLLIHHDPNGFVAGLDRVPPGLRPPVNVTHLSYNVMVSIGFALLGLAAWLAWAWWRRRDIPRTPWFLRAVALSGLAAVVALEAGWVATEVGRQPWIVYEIQLTRDAVSTAPGLRFGFYLVLAVYIVLTVMTAYVLRRLTGAHEASIAPQEPELEEQRVGGGT
ncbi:MAG TPA: cytochrome ubiquinol oxidase subunit I [Pseudonocardiaceae bacterium]|nr:cytochrome ubiquinol oxidase subunit I [Pseudonocardiaceae bacterium]